MSDLQPPADPTCDAVAPAQTAVLRAAPGGIGTEKRSEMGGDIRTTFVTWPRWSSARARASYPATAEKSELPSDKTLGTLKQELLPAKVRGNCQRSARAIS